MEHLGKILRDPITGYKGVATSYEESPFNVPRYGLQAQMKEGEPSLSDGYTFDADDLTIEDEKQVLIPKTPQVSEHQFLDVVQDIVSGIKGKITSKITYLSGCIHYVVGFPPNKDGEMVPSMRFASGRLQPVPNAVKATPINPSVRGGPHERSQRY
jgi:hypothetical protein